jgi:hypothetical protein
LPVCADHTADANRALDALYHNPGPATARAVLDVFAASRCRLCDTFHVSRKVYARFIGARVKYDAVGDALSLEMFGALT